MKTQLLEDIGESATLSLVPSGRVANTTSHQGGPDIAQAPAAASVRPRSEFIWRQRPAGEPVVIASQQPDEAPPPLVVPQPPSEPIAAVEAQHEQVHEPAIPPAEPTFAAQATQSNPVPQGPEFHFAPPWPTRPAPIRVRREPSWFERSGKRYLLWGSCVLAGALVIQAGLWLYEERKVSRALVADQLKAEPQADNAAKRRAIGAKKEFTLGADGEVLMTPAAPASSPSPLLPAAPAVPPLVLLEPDPAAAAKAGPTALLKADRQAPLKPELVAEQAPAVPLPKRARARAEPAPDRQIARAPVIHAEKKTEPDSASAALLKACREHGYHAAQCVKRACSMTKYGFVCRGK